MTLAVFGDGPKKAVLFTLEEKYDLPLNGPLLSLDRASNAIIDLFGQDGGQLLLEQLWVNLEVLAESKITTFNENKFVNRLAVQDEWSKSDEGFNKLVSQALRDSISEMYGEEFFTWLEERMRLEGTTLSNCYHDADKINEILWRLFRSATTFLIENILGRLSLATKSQPFHYNSELTLKESLEQFRRQAKRIL